MPPFQPLDLSPTVRTVLSGWRRRAVELSEWAFRAYEEEGRTLPDAKDAVLELRSDFDRHHEGLEPALARVLDEFLDHCEVILSRTASNRERRCSQAAARFAETIERVLGPSK